MAAEFEDNSFFRLKVIGFGERNVPILAQNANGPCPLLAIANVLLLRGSIDIHTDRPQISYDELVELVGDFLLRSNTLNEGDDGAADRAQNLTDCMGMFPKLSRGLDVNVRFTGCRDFAFTAEHLVFDLCRVRMLHGWICDKQDAAAAAVIGRCTYDELIEKVIECNALAPDGKAEGAPAAGAAPAPSEAERERIVREGLIAQEFLNSTASQLTYLGLVELHGELRDNELAALFRNNHFSTIYKRDSELYVLVTDLGYLHEAAVWERLDALDGDTALCGADFAAVKESERQRDHEVSALLGDVTMHERAALGARAPQPQPQPPQGDLLSAAFLAEHLGAGAQPALPIAQAVPLAPRADAVAATAPRPHVSADSDLALAMQLQAELDAEARAEALAAQRRLAAQQQQQQLPPAAARAGGGPPARSQSTALPTGTPMTTPRGAAPSRASSSGRPNAPVSPKSKCELM